MKTAERRRAEQHLAVQYAVTRALASSRMLEDATPAILREICIHLGWDMGAMWRTHDDSGILAVVAIWAPSEDLSAFRALTRETVLHPGRGLPGRVCETGKPAWIADVTKDSGFTRSVAATVAGLHGACAFPVTEEGRVAAVLEFFSRDVREPDEELLQVMASLGSQIGQFIERKAAEQAVRDSEARKGAILESALDCIVSMDQEGRIVEFNPAAERTFGYRREQVLGKLVADTIVPPSLREEHLRGIARYLETGEARVLGRRIETLGMRADGREFPVELGIARVAAVDPPLFTASARDITGRKRSDEQREEALRREREARSQAEAATQRLAFLSEASSVLGASLDYETTLANVAMLAVPHVADWCFVDVIDPDGSARRVGIAHEDPAKVELAREIQRRYPTTRTSSFGSAESHASGQPEIVSEVPDGFLRSAARDEDHLRMLEEFGIRSYITVPLTARGRTLGAITFAMAQSKRRYGPSELALAEDLARRAALAVDNARLFGERTRIARKLQESLLPPRLPWISGVEVAARYRAAGEGVEVGGDFYDVFELGKGSWGAVIGDACGKGVEAAAVTGLARHTVRAAAMQHSKPSEILGALNEAIIRQPGEQPFCTVCFVRLRRKGAGARLTVSCGGHPPPLVLRADGTVGRAGRPGTLLGVFPDPEVHDHALDLGPGDALVLFTDGVVEAHRAGDLFGEERLAGILASCTERDATEIVDAVDGAVLEFQPEGPRDDVAILVLRVTPHDDA